MALTSHLSWREKEIYVIFISQIGRRLQCCKTLARVEVSPHLCSLIRPLKLSKVQCPTSLLNKVVTNLDIGMIWRCFEHLLIVLKVLTCSMLYSAKLALYSGYWNRGKVIIGQIYGDNTCGMGIITPAFLLWDWSVISFRQPRMLWTRILRRKVIVIPL